MNVTKRNFPAVLMHLKEMLSHARFITIDCEMTGISDHLHPERFYDMPEESLRKKILVAKKYGLIQLGVCLFEDMTECSVNANCSLKGFTKSSYMVRPFNFYVFPSIDAETSSFSKTFSMDPQAVNFNKKHNMDFQKWIYEGVGYCTAEHEQAYVASVKNNCQSKIKSIDREQKKIAEDVITLIEKWKNEQPPVDVLKLPDISSQHIVNYVEYYYANAKYKFETRGNSWTVSRRKSPIVQTTEKERITEFVGMREVFKIIRACRKPIIGHNILMDLLFFMEAVDGPLPLDTLSIRERLNRNFPIVWDTKVLAVHSENITSRLEHISLQNMFEDYILNPHFRGQVRDDTCTSNMNGAISVKALPGLYFPLGFERYSTIFRERDIKSEKSLTYAHEAGWDSLTTGFVFLNLCEELENKVLEKGVNKVALYKNFHSLNLNPHDDAFHWLARGKVLKLSFDSIMTPLELASSLAPLKGQIMWIEEGTAAILLDTEHSVNEAIEHFLKHPEKIHLEEIFPSK